MGLSQRQILTDSMLLTIKKFFFAFPASSLLKRGLMPFIFKIAGILFGFITAFIVSKKYGADGWGIFSLITTAAMFCIYFGKLGFDTGLLKFTADLEAQNNRLATASLYYKLVAILLPLCLIGTWSIVQYADNLALLIFQKAHLAKYLRVGALLIFPSIFILIHSEGLRGLKNFGMYSFLQNTGVYLIFIILFFLWESYLEADNLSPLYIYVISTYAIFLISTYWWLRRIFKPSIGANTTINLSKFFKVSVPMFWSNLMIIVIGWTDTLLLGIFDEQSEVGVYNVALKISNMVIMPLLIANSILAPYYAELSFKRSLTELELLVTKASKMILMFSVPIFLVIASFPKLLLGLFGQEYEKGKYILLILAVGQLFNTFCGTTDTLLQMTGNEKAFRNIIGTGTLVNVLLNIILIPRYGIYGAAFTNCLSLIVWNVIGLLYIKNKLSINMVYNPFKK